MYVAIERARAVCQYAALVLAENDPAMAHGGVDGQGGGRRLPEDRHPPTASSCSAASASRGRTISRSACGGPSSARSCSAAPANTAAASRRRHSRHEAHLPPRGRSRPRRVLGLARRAPPARRRRRTRGRSRRPTSRRGPARSRRRCSTPAGCCPASPRSSAGATLPCSNSSSSRTRLTRRRVYHSFNPQGLGIIAPSILMFGTPEQKQRWAVPILRAEITAALGMSEPNAGSDLAGLRTRAVLDGDEFVVNGQKVWTSGAHDADVIFTFVRTDPDAPKHKGLSALVIPTDTAGVTAPPVRLDHEPRRPRLQRGVLRRRPRARRRTSSANSTRAGASPPARSARSGRCSG